MPPRTIPPLAAGSPRYDEAMAMFAARAAAALDDRPATEIIRWAHELFGDRLAVTSSMGDGLIAHLCAMVVPHVEVLFLDTGYHFPETYRFAARIAAGHSGTGTGGPTVRTILPARTVTEQDQVHGPQLYARNPDLCCRLRKVEPLDAALAGYDAWISGIRRDETVDRAATPVVGYDVRRRIVKISPIAHWTRQDADAYLRRHRVPVHPLAPAGYPSIGCAPCTRPVAPGEDPRSGRWAGTAKSECGIHR